MEEVEKYLIEFYVIFMLVDMCVIHFYTFFSYCAHTQNTTTPTKIAIQWQILRFIIIIFVFSYLVPIYKCDTNGKNE